MDYEKAYKEALERAKEINNEHRAQPFDVMTRVFSELKKSEDEKIRKVLIDMFKAYNIQKVGDFTNKEIIAWLEKQGESKFEQCIQEGDKIVTNEDGTHFNVSQLERVTKKEPKFKVGDWVVVNGNVKQIVRIEHFTSGHPQYILSDGLWFGNGTTARLWSIRDAKDGDVLQLGEVTAIFKEYIGNEFCICYCSFCKDGGFEIPSQNGKDNVYGCYDDTIPATKEQRNLLFQKMEDAGYEWDAEKKELKKIEDEPLVIDEGKAEMDYCFTKMMNSEKINPAWSEEDERMSNAVIRACKYIVENFENSTKDCEDAIDWLKTLKDRVQSQWKPSEEQLNALNTLNLHGDISYVGQQKQLIELYEQLKKL